MDKIPDRCAIKRKKIVFFVVILHCLQRARFATCFSLYFSFFSEFIFVCILKFYYALICVKKVEIAV